MARARQFMMLAILFFFFLLALLILGLMAACIMLYPDMVRVGLHL